MIDKTADAYEQIGGYLRMPDIVLRDSLGTLAIHILTARKGFENMTYQDALYELREIIVELHKEYQHGRYGEN